MGGVTEPLSALINGGLWNGWCGQSCLRFNVSDHHPQVYQRARKYRMCCSLKKESGITPEHIFQRLRYLSSSYGVISHNPNSQTWPAMTFSHLQMHTHTHSVASHRLTNVSNLHPSSQKASCLYHSFSWRFISSISFHPSFISFHQTHSRFGQKNAWAFTC